MLRYLSSAPESGEIRGSEPKAAASSEICLCHYGSGQTCTWEDEGAARTEGRKKNQGTHHEHWVVLGSDWIVQRLRSVPSPPSPKVSPNPLHAANCKKGRAEKIPPGPRWKKYPLSQAGKIQISPSAQDSAASAPSPYCNVQGRSPPNRRNSTSHETPPAAPGPKSDLAFQTRSKIPSCETH